MSTLKYLTFLETFQATNQVFSFFIQFIRDQHDNYFGETVYLSFTFRLKPFKY